MKLPSVSTASESLSSPALKLTVLGVRLATTKLRYGTFNANKLPAKDRLIVAGITLGSTAALAAIYFGIEHVIEHRRARQEELIVVDDQPAIK